MITGYIIGVSVPRGSFSLPALDVEFPLNTLSVRRCVFFPRGSSIRRISFRSFIQNSRSVAASESSVFETKTGMSTGSETAGSELSVKNANKSRTIQQLMCHL